MLKASDIWVLLLLIGFALAAALLQSKPEKQSLSVRDRHIRATINDYMRHASALGKTDDCALAKRAASWQFESAARRLDFKKRVQLLIMTTKKGRTLRLRFILEPLQDKEWQIIACAVINELREA